MGTIKNWVCKYRHHEFALNFWRIGILLLLFCERECHAVKHLTFFASENTTVGTNVGNLSAIESSDGYILTSGDDSPFRKHFDIVRLQSEGVIITSDILDHETTPLYDATVYDSNAEETYEITVNITDINDNYPTFTEKALVLVISEASQIGSKFDIGSAVDSDSYPNNVQGYHITSGNAADFFRLNLRYINGLVFADLVVNRTLNREENASFSFKVEAYDGGTPPKTGTMNIIVEISDINDNAPQFALSRYSVAIKEDASVGTDIITLNATDHDIGANGNITYRIDRGQSDPEKVFEVEPTSGRIYLNKRLDFEQTVQYKLVLEAVDAGSEPQSSSTVIIVSVKDVNDNKPSINVIFLDAKGPKVSEAAQPGDFIARVSVSDPDEGVASHVNVTLTGGSGRFGLQTQNNVVYLVCLKQPLDRETQATHHITLTATDQGSPSQSAQTSFTITVEDANDNSPQFEKDSYEVFLTEDAFRGTFVAHLTATDIDAGVNAEVSYRLGLTSQSNWFNINPDSGLVTTKEHLDHSVNPAPNLVVIATDKGTPPLSSNTTLVVKISDASDNDPRFEVSSYSTSVSEDAPVGRCILQVTAIDPDVDSVTSYSFVTGSGQSPPTELRINSTTGDVCVKSLLDRETTATYRFQVQATDEGGRFDRARVFVTVDDVNEFQPVFHPVIYMVNVDRNADVGSPVTIVTATDGDDVADSPFGSVTYDVTSGNEKGFFKLNAISGRLSVAAPLGGLGVDDVHNLTISAKDGGGLTSEENATVSISIVDGTSTGGPVFSASMYSFSADEDADLGSLIGNVEAIAPDGGEVIYQLRKDPPNTNWFSINSNTGNVTVFSVMDREILSTVSFQIIASSGFPPAYGFASVIVTLNDVNDNAPVFDGATEGKLDPIFVPFDLRSGTTVSTIAAIDNDEADNGRVRYHLSHPYFRIDETTAELFVASRLPQSPADYSLTIEARDMGQPPHVTNTSLTVFTRDPDINCPEFPNSNYIFNIAENYPISTVFGSLNAMKIGSSSLPSYHLEGSFSFPFSIYPNGSIYLDAALDREVKDTYQFKVTAQGQLPTLSLFDAFCDSIADVTVIVDDVNDNTPQFAQSVYTFRVEENIRSGTEVGRVYANDEDSQRHAQVQYHFAVTNNDVFSIHPITGIITTKASLDRELTSQYRFLVDATDQVNMAQTTVHVIIDDVNDNTPLFLTGPAEHLAVVSVAEENDAWVADVRARDDDSGDNGRLTYSIVSPLTTLFVVDPQTGSVRTAGDLSQNDVGIHGLTIRAEDHGAPTRFASTTLKIKVHLADENPSQFSANKFVFTPPESSLPGDVLGSFGFEPSSLLRRRSMSSDPSFRIVSGNDVNTFSVNATNGDVILNRKLNYEDTTQYFITVEKRDEATDDVTILTGQFNIRDTNDHTPTFTSGSFQIGVEEDAGIGKEAWRFSATDQDSGLDGKVVYSLLSQTPTEAFMIDSDSGMLKVHSSLNRENISEYLLVIKAADSSVTSPRFSTVSCVVIIRDVNDNPPRFISRSETYVMEDEPIDFPIIRVVATDPDVGVNGHVTYSLVAAKSDSLSHNPDEETSYFHINSSTGVLTLTKKLDHEKATVHELNISATDGAPGNQLTTYQMLSIRVVDVNDVAPYFERVTYDAIVNEGQSSGVIVTRVKALDEDSGTNGELTYALQENSESNNFTIDSSTGVIITTSSLDREAVSMYTLTVFVQDNAFPSLYDWCTVQITVGDLNDNSPKFNPLDDSTEPPILARLNLPEQADGPEAVHVIAAFDPDADENGRISYSITDGNADGDFYMNATSGELWTQRQLDRETTAFYRLKLVASDHGQPPRSSSAIIEVIVQDWNDNDPQFVDFSYEGNVDESLSKGQYILTVRATDADEGPNGEVRYFMGPSNAGMELEGLFTVDSTTGVLTTAAILDREVKARYQFFVSAVDSSPYSLRNATVLVVVSVNDINDNPPIFENSLLRLNVSRDTLVGSIVNDVKANDDDIGRNGDVMYSIADTSDSGNFFTVGSSDGSIRVNRSLAAIPSQYSINIIASDQGNPPLKTEAVVIISIVGETNTVGNLQFGNLSYSTTMWENVQKGFLVTKVKANVVGLPDNVSDITYEILFGNEKGRLFAISNDGDITVNEPSLLDFETKPKIPLFVSATASGGPTSPTIYGFATVNIQLLDENDNSPKFSQLNYYTRVWEEQGPSFVMQLFASDADSGNNGKIRFHIASGDPDGAFLIGPTTGFLQTERSLDREIHDKYELIVYATDLGDTRKTGTCTVSVDVVDINDHSPTLRVPSESILISEDTSVGSLLTSITANDVDINQEVVFYFASGLGNPGGLFAMDRHSGDIFVTKILDHETVDNVTLMVEASDGANAVRAQFDVIITDVNDNAPQFSESLYHTKISELTPPNTPVITVHADDVDSSNNGRVTYELLNIIPNLPMFSIDSESGVISTNKSEPFNPQSSVFNLEIEARDHGNPSKAQSVSVRIERTDVNNNPPSFSQSIYEGSVAESAPVGFSVINVTATDADFSSDNKNIYYQIESGNTGDVFSVRTISEAGKQSLGELRVASELDRETVSMYQLTVSALDHGSPQLSSMTKVSVRILDVNDNQPRFNQSRYVGSVKENDEEAEPRTSKPVVSVHASDPDASVTSDFKFKIISGNDGGAFDLEECNPPFASCAQVVAKLVDYETKPHYELTIQVSDQHNSILARSSTALVAVDVVNVNEYRPVAERFKLEKVLETTRANQTLFYIAATDNDAGNFGRVTFVVDDDDFIGEGEECPSPRDMFAVQAVTGAVRAKKDLDFEKCKKYYFFVEVCDPGGCWDRIPVEINVLPVDEFAPQFFTGDQPTIGSGYRFEVPYGSPAGHIVGQVSAVDHDEGDDGSIRFSLGENTIGQASSNYVINVTTGVISVLRRVDSGNARILILTAESSTLKTITHVTIEIVGTPSIAPEAQVLSIVFGVIAGVACIIVLIITVKHCMNKRAYKSASAGQEDESGKVGNRDDLAERSSNREFYDVTRGGGFATISPAYVTALNGARTNGNHKKGGKPGANMAAGDFQLHKINSGNNTPAGLKDKRRTPPDGQGHKVVKEGGDLDRTLRHRIMRPPRPAHTGNDGSAEDEEVNHITSTPTTSGQESSATILVPNKPRRVADSGIQQDIDKTSENTEVTIRSSHGESVESIHEFGDEGGGENSLDVNVSGILPQSAEINYGGGEEMPSDVLGIPQSAPKPTLSVLIAPAEGQPIPEVPSEQNWTPEFEPLSSVFTEIARLREISVGAMHGQAPKASGLPMNKPTYSSATNLGRPPPLLTSVPQRSGGLAAPVPIAPQSKRGFQSTHVPLKGLYPRPSHQYQHSNPSLPSVRSQPIGVPPPYSHVMASRPSSGSSSKSRHSLHSQQLSSNLPYAPSTASALSVASMPRTPLSLESSFTSPAMSPSLSPSLTPLTAHSPPTLPLGRLAESPTKDEAIPAVVRPRSLETKLSVDPEERMVHV